MYHSITDILDETVRKYPDKTAFVDEQRSLTYGGLQREAISIAHRLTDFGLFKKPVLIFMEKSVDCVSCFFGVAYSGNFYTIVDTSMPDERLRYIFENFEPAVVISDMEHEHRVKTLLVDSDISSDTPILGIGECLNINESAVADGNINNVQAYPASGELRCNHPSDNTIGKVRSKSDRIISTDLICVLYTSGSTGTPKGVVISHAALIDYMLATECAFEISSNDFLLNSLSFSFAGSLIDIYTTVRSGASLYIDRKICNKPNQFIERLNSTCYTTLTLSAAEMTILSSYFSVNAFVFHSIKKIIFMGSALVSSILQLWSNIAPDAKIYNLYGATETLGKFCHEVDKKRKYKQIPIGKPLANTDYFILSADCDNVKDDVGELFVRCAIPHIGYYKDREHTDRVFAVNPLNPHYTERIYKTGDLARVNEYGEVEIVGRADTMIKHHGYRIAPEEIEQSTLTLEGVTECCCAYDVEREQIVLIYSGQIGQMELLRELKDKLPSYMLPERLEKLESLPHTPSGKIDRVRLSAY